MKKQTLKTHCKQCNKKIFVKDMCRSHYVKWHKKQNPESYKKAQDKYQKSDKYKEYRRDYRIKNNVKSIPYMNNKRFGGLREEVIQRDQEQCVECNMTRKEHKNKWGRDITVDHIDGEGRYSKNPNNELNNLVTMCLSCHGRKDKCGIISK
jgi:hypothetical protein